MARKLLLFYFYYILLLFIFRALFHWAAFPRFPAEFGLVCCLRFGVVFQIYMHVCMYVGFSLALVGLQFWVTWHLANAFVCFSSALLCFSYAFFMLFCQTGDAVSLLALEEPLSGWCTSVCALFCVVELASETRTFDPVSTITTREEQRLGFHSPAFWTTGRLFGFSTPKALTFMSVTVLRVLRIARIKGLLKCPGFYWFSRAL